MHKLFEQLTHDKLIWLPELDIGYYHVDPNNTPYNSDYFDKYRQMADTPMGHALNKARCELVARHWTGPVCDIGIGDGAFLRAREERGHHHDAGYDVNPAGEQYLIARRQYMSISHPAPRHAFTFWDSFEHIHDFRHALAHAGEWVFMAVPIFNNPAHVLRSKHYRKDEHCWYFTAPGLLRVMSRFGFENIEINDEEVAIGREDVRSFAFKRKIIQLF